MKLADLQRQTCIDYLRARGFHEGIDRTLAIHAEKKRAVEAAVVREADGYTGIPCNAEERAQAAERMRKRPGSRPSKLAGGMRV